MKRSPVMCITGLLILGNLLSGCARDAGDPASLASKSAPHQTTSGTAAGGDGSPLRSSSSPRVAGSESRSDPILTVGDLTTPMADHQAALSTDTLRTSVSLASGSGKPARTFLRLPTRNSTVVEVRVGTQARPSMQRER